MSLLLAVMTTFLAGDPASFPTCQGRSVDPAVLVDLGELEVQAGVPEHRRGILAAIWCVESVWSPSGVPLVGDHGEAIGPFQWHVQAMMPCLPKGYAGHDPRPELGWSAACWLKRVNDLLPRAEAWCGRRRAFDVAEAMVSAPARYGWRCDARSLHVKLLEAWRLALDRGRKVAIDDLHLDAEEAPDRGDVDGD